jgi:hypothetical protein
VVEMRVGGRRGEEARRRAGAQRRDTMERSEVVAALERRNSSGARRQRRFLPSKTDFTHPPRERLQRLPRDAQQPSEYP